MLNRHVVQQLSSYCLNPEYVVQQLSSYCLILEQGQTAVTQSVLGTTGHGPLAGYTRACGMVCWLQAWRCQYLWLLISSQMPWHCTGRGTAVGTTRIVLLGGAFVSNLVSATVLAACMWKCCLSKRKQHSVTANVIWGLYMRPFERAWAFLTAARLGG